MMLGLGAVECDPGMLAETGECYPVQVAVDQLPAPDRIGPTQIRLTVQQTQPCAETDPKTGACADWLPGVRNNVVLVALAVVGGIVLLPAFTGR